MESKQLDLMGRARAGVLKFVSDRGGSAGLGVLHEFTETKFLIAHQGFSRLMESLVSEGLIEFDFSSNTATLTQAGQEKK